MAAERNRLANPAGVDGVNMLSENKKHWGIEGYPNPTAGEAIERADRVVEGAWKEISFSVPGKPVGKARPRFSKNRTYTPKKTVEYEKWVQSCCTMECKNRIPGYTGPIEAQIMAYYPVPKSVSKIKREKMLSGAIKPGVKPDLDNVAKSILDALNGVAYYDDNQVTDLKVAKRYSEKPSVDEILKISVWTMTIAVISYRKERL